MSKTLADVRINVRMYLDEAQPADYLDSEITIAINFAYHDVVGHVMEVKEDYYQTTTPFTYAVVANQQEYAVDSSLIKINRVEVNMSPNISNAVPLRAIPVKMNEMLINLSNTATNDFLGNVGYFLHGDQTAQKIGFIPYPTVSDTGSTKSISVWGISLPSDLALETDLLNIPWVDRYAYLVGLRAAAHLLSKGQQDEKPSSKYLGLYNSGILELKNFLANRQEDGVEMVQDEFLENTDFGFPL